MMPALSMRRPAASARLLQAEKAAAPMFARVCLCRIGRASQRLPLQKMATRLTGFEELWPGRHKKRFRQR
jgi:hypothetical protein